MKCLKRDSILKEAEDSLRRLKLDVIDLYQMHWPEPDEDIEEGWSAMAELQQQGKVRFIGVSNFNVAQLKRAQKIAPVTSLQPPYSLVSPEVGEEILPYCLAQNIGVIVYAPMKSGLLTGAMTRERVANLPDDDFPQARSQLPGAAISRRIWRLLICFAKSATSTAAPPGEVAIAWTLANPAVTAAIVGMRNASQVHGVIGAATFRLSHAETAQLEALTAKPVDVFTHA